MFRPFRLLVYRIQKRKVKKEIDQSRKDLSKDTRIKGIVIIVKIPKKSSEP